MELPLIIIFILDRIFPDGVVAAFIVFVTFAVFTGMSLSGAKTIVTALVSRRLDDYNSLFHNNVLKDIFLKDIVGNIIIFSVNKKTPV